MSTPSIISRWQSYSPYFLAALRIMSAIVFIQHGTVKLWDWPDSGRPAKEIELFSQIGLGAVLETFGGLLLLVGLWTRPSAFLLSGTMAVAYFQFHQPKAFWTLTNHGDSAVLFCFIWLFYSAAGAGKWSIDEMLARKKSLPS